MSNVSKMVADRLAISATVMTSLSVHGASAAPAIEAILFPDGPPESLTVRDFLKALHDSLERNRNQLRDADLAHAAELADDEAPRAARDAAVAALRGTLTALRGNMINIYGSAVAVAYGVPSPIPESDDLLIRAATTVEQKLRERALTEASKNAGFAVDRAAVADVLKGLLAEVGAAAADVEREKREAQLTLKAKSAALSQWSTIYQGVADATAGLYALAGLSELSDLVRPTARRRAGLTEEEDMNPALSGEPSLRAPK